MDWGSIGSLKMGVRVWTRVYRLSIEGETLSDTKIESDPGNLKP